MKHFLHHTLITLLLGTALVGAQTDEELRQLERSNVPVIDRTGGGRSQVQLVGVEGNEIKIAIENGQLMVPMDLPELRLFFRVPDLVGNAQGLMRAGEYEQAFEMLRPVGYPLLKYVKIPPEKFNIHGTLALFYEAAIRAGDITEARYIANRLPLEEIDPYYTNLSFQLAAKIAENGETQQAMELMEKLPLNAENPELLEFALNFAAQLREQDSLTEALFLYQKLAAMDAPGIKRTATLWNAYCNFRLGNKSIARVFFESVEEIPSDHPDFSLYQLVQGRMLLDENEPEQALIHLSKGIVYGQLSYDWMPELFYLAGKGYKDSAYGKASQEVYAQLTTFYPNSKWAAAAKE